MEGSGIKEQAAGGLLRRLADAKEIQLGIRAHSHVAGCILPTDKNLAVLNILHAKVRKRRIARFKFDLFNMLLAIILFQHHLYLLQRLAGGRIGRENAIAGRTVADRQSIGITGELRVLLIILFQLITADDNKELAIPKIRKLNFQRIRNIVAVFGVLQFLAEQDGFGVLFVHHSEPCRPGVTQVNGGLFRGNLKPQAFAVKFLYYVFKVVQIGHDGSLGARKSLSGGLKPGSIGPQGLESLRLCLFVHLQLAKFMGKQRRLRVKGNCLALVLIGNLLHLVFPGQCI